MKGSEMKLPNFKIQVTKTQIAKTVVVLVVVAGVAKITKDIINNNVECETNFDSVKVAVARLAITGIVTKFCKAQTDKLIDETIATIQLAKRLSTNLETLEEYIYAPME
jgi:high-affinity Fe2+/Pb2+ permease